MKKNNNYIKMFEEFSNDLDEKDLLLEQTDFEESEDGEKSAGEVTLDTINDILKGIAEDYPEGGPGEINVINFTQNNITLTVPFEDGFYGETMEYGEGDDLEEIVPKMIKTIQNKIKDIANGLSELEVEKKYETEGDN